jgi:uncharacterized protein
MPEPETLLILSAVATLAGLVDAMAGGGGLLTLPALLWAGLSPLQALATNKLQGTFGTLAATLHFLRQGEIHLGEMGLAIALTFSGALLGSVAVQQVDSERLEWLLPLLLIGFAFYFLLSPRVGDLGARQRIGPFLFALSGGFGIGFYDGFFGPGTGSFFALAFVALLGFNLRRATAHAKLLNFTSNLASLLVFLTSGQAAWALGLGMAAGQFLGGWLGAHLVLRHGARLIRPLLVLVSLVLAVRLLLEH